MISPFKYAACDIICSNKSISISYKDINRLRLKNKFKPIDSDILELLYQFKYLNKHNLNIYYGNSDKFKNFSLSSDLKSRLSFMWDSGILLRYYFLWHDESKRSPNFYTLSRGSLSYLKRMHNLKIKVDESLIVESPEIVFKRLATNQLVINYISKLKNLKRFRLNVPLYSKRYNEKFELFALIQMHYNDNEVPIIIEPVRRIINWEKELTNRLLFLKDILMLSIAVKEGVITKPPLVVLLCEDDKHIIEIFERTIIKTNINFDIFYTTDESQMNTDLTNSLFSFNKKTDNQWCLFEHSTNILT